MHVYQYSDITVLGFPTVLLSRGTFVYYYKLINLDVQMKASSHNILDRRSCLCYVEIFTHVQGHNFQQTITEWCHWNVCQ